MHTNKFITNYQLNELQTTSCMEYKSIDPKMNTSVKFLCACHTGGIKPQHEHCKSWGCLAQGNETCETLI